MDGGRSRHRGRGPGALRAGLHEGLRPEPLRRLGGADGRLVGHAEIKRTDEAGGHEIVYALAPEAWGSGLGTELAEAIVAYGFDTLGLAEVHATVAEPNTASLVLLERIGFAHVRDVREDDGSTTRVLTRRGVPAA